MNDLKMPIIRPGELIGRWKSLDFHAQKTQKEVISAINIQMEERQQLLFIKEKT